MILRIIFWVLVSLSAQSSLCGQLSEQATLSILTCRPGSDIYAMYGHTAIRLQDPVLRKDIVYNYGVFDFNEPNFVMKFLRGKLLYRLSKSAYTNFIRQYTTQKRSIHEQVLDLSVAETNQLYQALETNYLPQNRHYLYDFFFDNCSTRQRDILIDHLPTLTFPIKTDKNYTYRTLLDAYTYAWPWTDFGQDLIVGAISDAPADVEGQMYLPEFFFMHLDRSTIDHRPLIKSTTLILDYEQEAQQRGQTPWPTPAILFGLLLLLELFIFIKKNKKTPKWVIRYDQVWFALSAIGALVILFMWLGTDHVATKSNLNIAWMSPVYFWIFFNKGRSMILFTCVTTLLALLISPWIQALHICSIIAAVILLLKLIRYYALADSIDLSDVEAV